MTKFAFDHSDDRVVIQFEPFTELAEGLRRIEVPGPDTLKRLAPELLDRVYVELHGEPPQPDIDIMSGIWALLQERGKDIAAGASLGSADEAKEQPEKLGKTDKKPRKRSKKKIEKPPSGPLTETDASSTSVASGEPAGKPRKEAIMANKKAKKKTAKKTKGNGGPRGEKTKKVFALLTRAKGCTRKDILSATGWPAVSVQQMAKSLGLKLTVDKEKGKPMVYTGAVKG